MLSVVTMAASNKHLDYSQLMERLDLGDVRELEDLLIECIYADIVVGRLDQQSSQLKIERVSGRDPSDLDIVNMCQKLDHWGLTVDNMILQVDTTSKQAANEYDVAKMKKTALKGRWGGGSLLLLLLGVGQDDLTFLFLSFVGYVFCSVVCAEQVNALKEKKQKQMSGSSKNNASSSSSSSSTMGGGWTGGSGTTGGGMDDGMEAALQASRVEY